MEYYYAIYFDLLMVKIVITYIDCIYRVELFAKLVKTSFENLKFTLNMSTQSVNLIE